jgi:hypothetical protein
LIVLPESPLFRSWYRPVDWQAVCGVVNSASRKYRTPVINARTWAGEETDFYDACHHLAGSGALKFCELLHREFLLPFYRGQPLPTGMDGSDPTWPAGHAAVALASIPLFAQ